MLVVSKNFHVMDSSNNDSDIKVTCLYIWMDHQICIGLSQTRNCKTISGSGRPKCWNLNSKQNDISLLCGTLAMENIYYHCEKDNPTDKLVFLHMQPSIPATVANKPSQSINSSRYTHIWLSYLVMQPLNKYHPIKSIQMTLASY